MLHRCSMRALVLALAALTLTFLFGVQPARATMADTIGGNGCKIVLPPNFLTPHGLATPLRLFGFDVGGQPCVESNFGEAAFAEAAVFDTSTQQIAGVYHPLIVDATHPTPAVAPTVPNFNPAHSIVAVWFGFNGAVLQIIGDTTNNCSTMVIGSRFGQNSACNFAAFFSAAHSAIANGALVVPPLGVARDGLPCPTTRDYSVVDQDPSDNVIAHELISASGAYAQDTPANRAAIGDNLVFNGSDNSLLNGGIDPALGCHGWQVRILEDASGATLRGSLATDELFAGAHQAPPIALVPLNDEMVLVRGAQNLVKLNAYRAFNDQPPEPSLAQAQADQVTYCTDLWTVGVPRLVADKSLDESEPSFIPGVGSNLYTFLAARFVVTWEVLRCQSLLPGAPPPPVSLTTDNNGTVIAATYQLHP